MDRVKRGRKVSGIDVRWFPVENAVRGVVANGIGHNISVEALDCRSTSAWLDDADGIQVRSTHCHRRRRHPDGRGQREKRRTSRQL